MSEASRRKLAGLCIALGGGGVGYALGFREGTGHSPAFGGLGSLAWGGFVILALVGRWMLRPVPRPDSN